MKTSSGFTGSQRAFAASIEIYWMANALIAGALGVRLEDLAVVTLAHELAHGTRIKAATSTACLGRMTVSQRARWKSRKAWRSFTPPSLREACIPRSGRLFRIRQTS